MEHVHVCIDDAGLFDELVHRGAPQASALYIVTKRKATEGGRSGAVIAFKAHVDGRLVDVQATATVRTLAVVLAGLQGAHGPEGDR